MKTRHLVWISLVHLVVGAAALVAQVQVPAKGPKTLRVITYNIGLGQDRDWGQRGQKVIGHITNIHPDVIALQEAFQFHNECCYGQNTIEREISWIENAPGAHNYFLHNALQQTPNFTFRNDDRPFIETSNGAGFTYGYLRDGSQSVFSGEILVINVHMPLDPPKHGLSQDQVYGKIKNMFSDRFGKNPKWPVIIMGDFNTNLPTVLAKLDTDFDVGAQYVNSDPGKVNKEIDFILANSGDASPYGLTAPGQSPYRVDGFGGKGSVGKVFNVPDLENNCPENFTAIAKGEDFNEAYCASDHPPVYLDIVFP